MISPLARLPGKHNIATIRDLLHAAFTAQTLPRFCRDDSRFRPLCDRFSPSDGLGDMVERVIEYCETYDLLADLLAEVEKANPRQYARFSAELGSAVPAVHQLPPLPDPDERSEPGHLPAGSRISGDVLFDILLTPPPSLAEHLQTGAFKTLVNDRTRDFVGREFIFKRIENALADPQFPSGYILIQGEPGIGKTSLVAELVKREGAVHHFNISASGIDTAEVFLGNICSQLIIRFGLNYKSLPRYATRNGSFLMQILEEISRMSTGAPILILIDALDEASDTDVSVSANCLYLPRTLPARVYFVVTSRPVERLRLQVEAVEPIAIGDRDPLNLDDVRRYVQAYIDTRAEVMDQRIAGWGTTASEFIETMVDKSDGNFMYIKFVLQDILKGTLTPSSMDSMRNLPHGLDEYYESHLQRTSQDKERFDRIVAPVIGCLAVIKSPVGIDDLAQSTGLSPLQVSRVIQEWRQFLQQDDRERWAIYHPSFQRFLARKLALNTFRQTIVDACFNQLSGGTGEESA